jgi:hypothetical protein
VRKEGTLEGSEMKNNAKYEWIDEHSDGEEEMKKYILIPNRERRSSYWGTMRMFLVKFLNRSQET